MRDRVRRALQRPGTADLSHHRRAVAAAGEAEARCEALTDAELADTARRAATAAPGRRTDGRADFCAAARESVRRTCGVRLFDEQLYGVLGLLDGLVVQMATGEGKTLCGAVAAAGFALQGRSVHVLSVNDYLARRDRLWTAPLTDLWGVTGDWIEQSHSPDRRRTAYATSVVFGSATEIGFDVLRDRLVRDVADRVLPHADVAIVDEADSVLIDQARVPLVLAGSADGEAFDRALTDLAATLRPGTDVRTDAEQRNIELTDRGVDRVEAALGGIDLYTEEHAPTLAAVHVALHAEFLLARDVDYIVRDRAVELVDPTRGRVAMRQRWPDGIQAAVEAKEGLEASATGAVLDQTTVGGLVERYDRVAGMTGTAVAVAEELREFHALEVAVVAPHRPCVRDDLPDRVVDTASERRDAVVARIVDVHAGGRPVLVGTPDVAASEDLATALRARGVEVAVLNARNDGDEAAVVARAGEPGRVTVSTQMAGRGTDIRLGGVDGTGPAHERVVADGGLYVLGYGRHTSSRLDDQLRGRAGRQGDPGVSEFFVALDDDVITRFGDGAPVAADDPQAARVVDRAQRVAQADELQVHRTTWNYHHLLDQQRARLLEHREQVLTTALASDDLAGRYPEQHAALVAAHGTEAVTRAARLIRLHHLDRRWSEHLAVVAELREGIHLRGLARGMTALSPLDEFHRDAMAALTTLTEDVDRDTGDAFAALDPDGPIEPDAVVPRPSSTWTYLATDTPYGSDAERALSGLVRVVAGRKAATRPGWSPVRIVLGLAVVAMVVAIAFLLVFG
ncbi:protein translocase subunit secA [Pseudonocardia sediminis]|uniref:Protein translocase subunit SecA n=1 Tax=Pseudonocardia sediminis TaxID=1397368 RepID=A0A4Q7UY36_PSEST|nr:accessory Sec system translocase SecA2 [Pseudonocardia sediminis]RZT85978.1 protein translocase subunit secA [Pseudonocardia sediminis]